MRLFSSFRYLIMTGLLFFLLACRTPSTPTTPTTNAEIASNFDSDLIVRDCFFRETGYAWVDENQNGTWEANESPLENVLFTVESTKPGLSYLRSIAVSNKKGEATLYLFLAGCPDARLQVRTDAPSPYQQTTTTYVTDDPADFTEVFAFGFVYPTHLPTPTPRPQNDLICTTREPIGDVAWAEALEIAPDGAVWIAKSNHVFRIAPGSQIASLILDTQDDGHVHHLAFASDGSVWLSQDGKLLHLSSSTWITHTIVTVESQSTDDTITALAVDHDNVVWVVTEKHGVSSYDPTTNKLVSFVINGKPIGAAYEIQAVQTAKDGSVWFFSSHFAYRLTQPDRNGAESSWQQIPLYQQETSSAQSLVVQEAVFDNMGNLWLVGYRASLPTLFKFDPVTGGWVTYDYFSTNGSMFAGSLSSIALAPDGSLWVSQTQNGIIHLLPTDAAGNNHWLHYGIEAGLKPNDLRLIIRVTDDEVIWLWGDRQGLTQCKEE